MKTQRRLLTWKSIRLWIGRVLSVVTFCVAFVFGAIFHLDLPVTRRAAESLVEVWLNDLLQGTIRIDHLKRLESGGLTAVGIEIFDPQDRPIFQVEELDVEFHLYRTVERVARFYEKLSIVVDRVTLRGCDLTLENTVNRDENGELLSHPSLVDAFSPRVPSSSPDTQSSGRPVRLWLATVELQEVFARTKLHSLPVLQMQTESARGSVLITEKGVALDVRQLGLTLSGLGGVDSSASGNLHLRAPGAFWGDLELALGDIRTSQSFRIEQGKLELQGAFPEIEPAAVRALWADWPLDQTIRIENNVSGVLPRLQVNATVQTARGEAQAQGSITVAPEFEADLDVDIFDLDLSALHSSWPRTTLHARSAFELWQGPERPHLELNATVLPSEIQDIPIPPIDVRGTYDERGLLFDVTLHERGLPLHLELRGPVDQPLGFELELKRTQLEQSPRVQQYFPSRGMIQGVITGQLLGDRVETQARLSGAQLAFQGARLAQFDFRGGTTVPLDDPLQLFAAWEIDARGLGYEQMFELTQAKAQVQGPLLQPYVKVQGTARDGTRLLLSGTSRTDRIELDRVQAELLGRGRPIHASVDHFSFIEQRLRADNLRLQSHGTLTAHVDLTAAGGKLQVSSQDLNLSHIEEVIGLPPGTMAGTLSTEIDLQIGDNSQGHLHVSIQNGQWQGLSDLQLELRSEWQKKNTQGLFSLAFAELGGLSGAWTLDLPGHPFSEQSYLNATGEAELNLEVVDLPILTRLLGHPGGLRLERGSAESRLKLTRNNAEHLPHLDWSMQTQKLSVAWGEDSDALRFNAIDLNLAASLEPEQNRGQMAVRLTDSLGDILSLGGTLRLPLDRWARELPNSHQLLTTLADAPLELVIAAPKRRLDEVPFLQDSPVRGHLTGRGTIRGSLRDPHLQLMLTGEQLSGAQGSLNIPLDGNVSLRFRPVTGALQGDLRLKQNTQDIGSASFQLRVPLQQFFSPPASPTTPLWTGYAQVVLDGAPLELLEQLAQRELEGYVQGSLTVERTGWQPQISADVRLRRLFVGDRSLGEGRLSLETHQEKLVAKAQFDDEYGALSASAELALATTPLFYTVAETRPIYMSLVSEKYDAAVLSPFLGGFITDLSGALTGNIRMELRPPEQSGQEWNTRFSGQMRMSEGTLTPTAMGLRLEDAAFQMEAGPEGALNTILIKNIRARARSERPNITGSAKLYFQNLQLLRGQLDIDLKEIPLLSSGVKLADITGGASASLQAQEDEMAVQVNVRELTVELDNILTRDLIDVSDNPSIEILQPLDKPEQEEHSNEASTAWNVQLQLGQGVRVKNRMFTIQLRGSPLVRYEDEMSLQGGIELVPGGRIQVLGRVFTIDYGSVAFNAEDTTNPHLDVSATWRTPNGILIRATIGGTAENPQLKWSSEPPAPGGEAEIVAMVLGGSGASRSGDASGAGLTYGAAVVNELLGQTGVRGLEVYATRQTSSSGGQVARLSEKTTDNYTAAIQVSDELWFEGSYKQERSGPESEPRSGFSGTLDWRFHPLWSARTEVGTLGVGADLLWQYRY